MKNIISIIEDDYGYKNSLEKNLPIDKNNDPLPLYTYPAIEYLNSLDFSGAKIFEFGSGNSTLYWLSKKCQLVSVEHNKNWIEKLSNKISNKKNHQFLNANNHQDYANSINQFSDNYFDLIVIDGKYSRLMCAKNAIGKIKKDGIVILDNSDWYPNSAKLLRENFDSIQIDFYGLRPSKTNAAVTSFFISRNAKLKSNSLKQPNYALGGKNKHSQFDNVLL